MAEFIHKMTRPGATKGAVTGRFRSWQQGQLLKAPEGEFSHLDPNDVTVVAEAPSVEQVSSVPDNTLTRESNPADADAPDAVPAQDAETPPETAETPPETADDAESDESDADAPDADTGDSDADTDAEPKPKPKRRSRRKTAKK